MVDITLEYSRPFRALKLWMAFRAHGVDAMRAAVARNVGQARLLYAEVGRHDDLEALCGPPHLSIVPFRHVPAGVDDLDGHNARLVQALQEDGRVWIAPARVDGRVCLRPCFVNFRTTDDDVLALVDIPEVGSQLARVHEPGEAGSAARAARLMALARGAARPPIAASASSWRSCRSCARPSRAASRPPSSRHALPAVLHPPALLPVDGLGHRALLADRRHVGAPLGRASAC